MYRHFYYGYPLPDLRHHLVAVAPIPYRARHALVMLTLRQLISVLPMIAAILIFVYLQARCVSSLTLAGSLPVVLSVPALVRNDLWWHPDSLAIYSSL
jgi:hypothetical protein